MLQEEFREANLHVVPEVETSELFNPGLANSSGKSGESNALELVNSVSASSDLLGISGSFLCLIHCLAPQLLALGVFSSAIAGVFSGEYWALLFWLTCFWAVFRSASQAVFPLTAWALWCSFALFSSGLFIELLYENIKWISYSGSFMLIFFHLIAFRQQLRWSVLRKKIRSPFREAGIGRC
jgi:hypothetical protein